MKYSLTLISTLASTVLATQAAVISGGSITATSSTALNSSYSADQTINESGLNTTFDPPQHDINTNQGWITTDSATDQQWLQWDLGQVYTLDSIRVWNFNQTSNNPDWRYAGIQQLDIFISSLADPGDPEDVATQANWTLWAENATLDLATGATDYIGSDLETTTGLALPTAIRHIRFEVDSNYGSVQAPPNASAVGLSEIQFNGTVVPEPSILALTGLGGLLMLRRRR